MSANFDKPFLFVGGVGVGNYYEFRDRLRGFSIEKRVVPTELTTWSASITLNNDDGAFTPRTTGIYADVNWFNQLWSLTPKQNIPVAGPGSLLLYDLSPFSSFTEQYFLGVVDTFDITDDGVSSNVEITLVDWLTIAARAPSLATVTPLASGSNTQLAMIRATIGTMETEYFDGNTALPVPPGFNANKVLVGGRSVEYLAPAENNQTQLDVTVLDATGNVADALSESVLPSQQCVVWPFTATRTTTNPIQTEYYFAYVGPSGMRAQDFGALSTLRTVLEFVEESATGDQVPFIAIDIGYQLDKLVNSVQATNVPTSADVSSFDSTSVIANGTRNASYTSFICETTEGAQTQVDLMVNRFSTPRYFPRSVTTSNAAIDATGLSTTRTAISSLLDLNGMWTPVTVTYTPTGHSTSITDRCIVSGVIVEAVPGDVRYTFELLPAVDYESFILDSSTLGVLDQNRLG